VWWPGDAEAPAGLAGIAGQVSVGYRADGAGLPFLGDGESLGVSGVGAAAVTLMVRTLRGGARWLERPVVLVPVVAGVVDTVGRQRFSAEMSQFNTLVGDGATVAPSPARSSATTETDQSQSQSTGVVGDGAGGADPVETKLLGWVPAGWGLIASGRGWPPRLLTTAGPRGLFRRTVRGLGRSSATDRERVVELGRLAARVFSVDGFTLDQVRGVRRLVGSARRAGVDVPTNWDGLLTLVARANHVWAAGDGTYTGALGDEFEVRHLLELFNVLRARRGRRVTWAELTTYVNSAEALGHRVRAVLPNVGVAPQAGHSVGGLAAGSGEVAGWGDVAAGLWGWGGAVGRGAGVVRGLIRWGLVNPWRVGVGLGTNCVLTGIATDVVGGGAASGRRSGPVRWWGENYAGRVG
jgi:hypothetical protein